jgi:hypothetical protein
MEKANGLGPLEGRPGRPRPPGPPADWWGRWCHRVSPRGRRPPTPSIAYINPPRGPLAHSFLSFPLFFLTWIPRLELCQRVEGNLSCWTPSRCWISSLSPSSFATMLNRISDDVYTPYVCIPQRHRLCGAGLLRLVRLHDLEVGFGCLHRQRSCGNVSAHSVFKGMNTVAIPLLFNYVDRSWAMGVEKFFVFCFESQHDPHL